MYRCILTSTNVWTQSCRSVKLTKIVTENDKLQFDYNLAKSINEMNNNTKAITSFEALKEYLKKKPVSSYITEI